ncbi:MAG: hypothetical protein JW963_10320 [Anaerolineales bacterium]|nr:hypothetical protein [Anaerolineales bacterium]
MKKLNCQSDGYAEGTVKQVIQLMTNLSITTIITLPNIYEFGFGKITARDTQ